MNKHSIPLMIALLTSVGAWSGFSRADTKIADSSANFGTTVGARTPDGVLEVVGGSATKPSVVVRGADSSASSGSVTGGTTPSFMIKQNGQVGINTLTPESTSILDIQSTSQGVLFPRLTTAQINAIASPARGLMVYDMDKGCLSINKTSPAANWACISTGDPSFNFTQLIISIGDLTKGAPSSGMANIPIGSVSFPGLVSVTAGPLQGISGSNNYSINTGTTSLPNFPWSYDGTGGPYTSGFNQVNVSLASSSGGGSSALQACVFDPTVADGSTSAKTSLSCNRLHTDFPALATGTYFVDPDRCGTTAPMQVFCDMTTDGGGWTLLGANGTAMTGTWAASAMTSPTASRGFIARATVQLLAANATTVQLRTGATVGGAITNKATSNNANAISALTSTVSTAGGAGTWHNGAAPFTTNLGSWGWTVSCGVSATGWPAMYHSCANAGSVHWFLDATSNRTSTGDPWATTWIR